MKHTRLFTAFALLLILVSCREKAGFEGTDQWYTSGGAAQADVFYVVSTNVASGIGEDGKDTYLALLTPEDKALMDNEFAFAAGMFGDSLNFFAPYYHQFTLSSMALGEDEFMPLRRRASDEVADAFDHYIEHMNGGRPFILAGFSQGAMHIIDILKHMTDEQFSRCAGAYAIGYRVSTEDLRHPHVNAAVSATDYGGIVSFNSVSDTTAIWPYITDGAAICMNPVSWCSDTTAAPFMYDDSAATVRVDKAHNVLVVDGLDPGKYFIPSLADYCKVGNLHLGDLLFYADHIGANARLRAYSQPDATGKRVVFAGDSITDGFWGRNDSRPAAERDHWDQNHIYGHGYMANSASYYLSKYPERHFSFFNRGIGGNTLADIEARWDSEVMALRPDVISLFVGVNDTFAPVDVSEWEMRYRRLLDRTLAFDPEVKFVLCTPFIQPVGRFGSSEGYPTQEASVKALAAAVRRIASDYGFVCVDFARQIDGIIAGDKSGNETYWIWDGIHPTAPTHLLMSQLWCRKAKKVLLSK